MEIKTEIEIDGITIKAGDEALFWDEGDSRRRKHHFICHAGPGTFSDPYKAVCKDGDVIEFQYCAPIKKKKVLKPADEIMKILVDEGYKYIGHGNWHHQTKLGFLAEFWGYCGNEAPHPTLDSWVKEVEE